MTDGTDTIDTELTRRLNELAVTTAADPGAWDRICARIEAAEAAGAAAPARRRLGPGLGLSPGSLVALAAAVALIVGVAAVALRRDDHDRVRMTNEPTTEPSTTEAPAPVTPGPSPTAPTTEAPTTPTTAPPPPACGQGCVDRATGDVDGDGRPDQVGLYGSPTVLDRAARSVRVVYATGTVEEVQLPPEFLVEHQLLGVTDLDGDGRGEVVYAYVPGAHTFWGGIVGTGGTGKLHRVGFAEDVPLVDGAAAAAMGFACPDIDGDGHREFVVTSAAADVGGAEITTMTETTTTFRWNGDRLVQNDQQSESVPFDGGRGLTAFAVASGGARCPGLASPSEGR